MTKCDRYQNLLMGFFDHELEGGDREALDEHLNSCPHCRALRQDLAGILGTLENAVPAEPGADLERLVLNRIMSLPARPERERDTLSMVLYGTFATLAALLLLMLGLSFQGMDYLDLVQAVQDYTYLFSALLVNLQIAYGIVTGLFPADVLELSREMLAVSLVAAFTLLIVAMKTAFKGPVAGKTDILRG
jgi:predicted anti-sigma-YlaC factor YlaD